MIRWEYLRSPAEVRMAMRVLPGKILQLSRYHINKVIIRENFNTFEFFKQLIDEIRIVRHYIIKCRIKGANN